jgi:adenosylcobinamide-phosphate synthase
LTGAFVVLAALALDLAFGDPPNRWHPVAWMGRALAAGQRRLCRGGRMRLMLGGAGLTLGVAGLAAAAAWLVARATDGLGPAGLVLQAGALKTMLSVRALADAAGAVARDLARGDLEAARRAVGHHLVSRPTAELSQGHVASAAIESTAENLTDSILAPLLFFAILGLPGAAAYRAVNTADAMIGYRQGALEYFGKVAARLDDLLNLIPARLGGLALVAAAPLAGAAGGRAWSAMRREHDFHRLASAVLRPAPHPACGSHGHTASPNASWTMAAMAGALGVRLEKPGHYVLGEGDLPSAAEIEVAVRAMRWAARLVAAALAGCLVLTER